MLNESDSESILEYFAAREGASIGLQIASDIQSGKIQLPPNKTIEVDISDYLKIPLKYRILAAVGSPLGINLANGIVSIDGGRIFLKSGKNYFRAKNKPAKFFYALSMVCSGTGSIGSGINVLFKRYQVSSIGVAGDWAGRGFLSIGNSMNSIGEALEGKTKKRWFRSPSKIITGHKGLSFVPGSNSYCPVTFKDLFVNLPVDKIILIGGSILTCYGYFKLMRSIYKYFYSKINQVDPVVTSKQIKISSIFLVYSSFSNANYRVYYAALRFG